MDTIEQKIKDILLLVQKPERYIGGELGSIQKSPRDGMLKFALCFPEVYELSASHLGGRIIYHILNQDPDILCERVYAPWVDMRDKMRENDIPMFSLESKRPLSEFDMIGFSLHYELTYTNILEMLYLGKIPFRSEERDEKFPLIIAGGSCAFNPEPLAPMVDIFYLGDAEEQLLKILKFINNNKQLEKENLLHKLTEFKGIYVPRFYNPEYKDGVFQGISTKLEVPLPVKSYHTQELVLDNYPDPPILPWLEITHDRLDLEVMRGCTRGCRFCMPGYIYRPLRERDPNDIITEVDRGIEKTGWSEVSLLSLSTPDYSALPELTQALKVISRDKVLSVATPSVRGDSTQDYLLNLVKEVRKSTLTFAPETGSERLRKVINKPLDEQEMLDAIKSASKMGWQKLKLYFMIGLPTETIKDLEDSVRLINKICRLFGKSKFNLKISISAFVPKPHTPFQWERQINMDEILERYQIITHKVMTPRVDFDTRDPRISFLEGVFCRGDRKLFEVIMKAWEKGAYLDAWYERLDFETWKTAFQTADINPESYLMKRDLDKPLPWEHISSGVSLEYLRKERDRAYNEIPIPDCRIIGCENCSNCDFEGMIKAKKEVKLVEKDEMKWGRKPRKVKSAATFRSYIRIKYTKENDLRFLSHLSVIRMLTRAIRRSKLPVAYSSGFTKRPKIAFSQPLPLGFSSIAEYMDIQFTKPITESDISNLKSTLPENIRCLEFKNIPNIINSLFSEINYSYFTIELREDTPIDIENEIKNLQERKPKLTVYKNKEIDVSQYILEAYLDTIDGREQLHLILENKPGRTLRPDTLLTALGFTEEIIAKLEIKRIEQLIREHNSIFTPMGDLWGEIIDGKIIRNQVESV